MIQPTEVFDVVWPDAFRVAPPRAENQAEMAHTMAAAFANLGFGEMTIEGQMRNVGRWLDKQQEAEIRGRASTLVYEKATGRLAGVCLIMLWQGWPVIYDIGVHPDFQGQGLARWMLQRALTVLKESYPVVRLNVAARNPAESVYYSLGFLPGPEIYHLIMPGKK